MNKKGAEMTVGTIVIIILALVVLVVLIYGFTTGWGNLWQNILGLGGGAANVKNIVQSCQVACTTGSFYDYCTKTNKVVYDNTGSKNPKNNEPAKTCNQLESDSSVGMGSCSNVICNAAGTLNGKECAQWGGVWKNPCTTNTQNPELSELNIALENYGLVLASDIASHSSEQCCKVKKSCTEWGGSLMSQSQCDSTQYYSINQNLLTDQLNAQVCCVR